MTQLFFNGKQIDTPQITDTERNLLDQIKDDFFGDTHACYYLTVEQDPEATISAGLVETEDIDWPRGGRSLGGVLASLQDKHIIMMSETENPYGNPITDVWFDQDAVKAILAR